MSRLPLVNEIETPKQLFSRTRRSNARTTSLVFPHSSRSWLWRLTDAIPPDGRHVVYKHWDANRCLLYVGTSRAFASRQETHRREAPWWRSVNSITVDTYESELVARASEALAIATEHPAHNVLWQRA